jgi:transcriptional regulator with XRE-family HTH domain
MPPQRKSTPLTPDHAALAEAIALQMAKHASMTQESVALEGKLSTKQVNDMVRGQANPTYTTMLRLCTGLHTSLGVLMTAVDGLREQQLHEAGPELESHEP